MVRQILCPLVSELEKPHYRHDKSSRTGWHVLGVGAGQTLSTVLRWDASAYHLGADKISGG